MVTGRPSIASSSSMKSCRCSGSSASSAAARSSAVSARMTRSISERRSPRNMCSVRHSPMPWAPRRRARAASSAVSALARTSSRRRWSAWLQQPVHGADQVGGLVVDAVERGVQAVLDVGLDR